MNDALWYLTRASGIVAAVLGVAALVLGFLFSARATGARRRPAWWLDLHNWLGGLTLALTAVHIVAAWLSSDTGIRILDVVVPGVAGDQRWAVTFGVMATYMLSVAVLTTWPRRLRHRRAWRMVHLGSAPAVALLLMHAYLMGTEAGSAVSGAGLIVLTAVSIYAGSLRALDRWTGRHPVKSQATPR